jgi:hypothetical protein
MKKINLDFSFWLAVISFVIAGFIIWVSFASDQATKKKVISETSRQVALTCTTDMATKFHIHPQLKIVIFGKEQTIPSNIGITSTCMNSIHTHDATGVIHIEAPIKKDFTLGDLFSSWQKTFTHEQVLDTKLSAQNKIVLTVNGKEVDTFDQTIMNDKDQILIEVK